MWVVFILSVVWLLGNYYLGKKLYSLPKNEAFFHNVKNISVPEEVMITPSSAYILKLTVLIGFMSAGFLWLSMYTKTLETPAYLFIGMIIVLYMIEISRKIVLTKDEMVLIKLFQKIKRIPLEAIEGIYIYSFNRRFFKGHAFTTKLVVCTAKEKYQYIISSLENKEVLNMIKDNFGVVENKMYIGVEKK